MVGYKSHKYVLLVYGLWWNSIISLTIFSSSLLESSTILLNNTAPSVDGAVALFFSNNLRALEFHMEGNHFPVGLGDLMDLPGQFLFQAGIPGDAQQGGAGTGQAEAGTQGADITFNGFVVLDQGFPVLLMQFPLMSRLR